MDDIEELLLPRTGSNVKKPLIIVPKMRMMRNGAKNDSQKKDIFHHEQKEKQEERFYAPGKGTVFVKTWGCSHNTSDAEIMSGLLSEQGYAITDDPSVDADAYILNSCTVKGPSEQSFWRHTDELLSKGKKVIVSGCVPQGDFAKNDFAKNDFFLSKSKNNNDDNEEASLLQKKTFSKKKITTKYQNLSVVGTQQIDQIVHVVEETLKGNQVHFIKHLGGGGGGGGSEKKNENDKMVSLDMPKIRKNRFIEIIPINTGCLNHCTYCKTRDARGSLKSWSLLQIEARTRSVLRDLSTKEIWLTSEDTGAYGLDIGTTLPALLKKILLILQDHKLATGKHVMLRLGMTNPPYIQRYLDDLLSIFEHPHMYMFLHIPVQSGSDQVLRDMKREYLAREFCKVVDFFNLNLSFSSFGSFSSSSFGSPSFGSSSPYLHVATDFICGFPTESDIYHGESLKLLQKYQFPTVNITQFYPRPDTPAAAMKQLDGATKKKRTSEMVEYFHSYSPLEKVFRVGSIIKVYAVTEYGAPGQNRLQSEHVVAHTKSYDQVFILFPGSPEHTSDHQIDSFFENLEEMYPELPGEMYVKIRSISKYSMVADLVSFSEPKLSEPKLSELKLSEPKLPSSDALTTPVDPVEPTNPTKTAASFFFITKTQILLFFLPLFFFLFSRLFSFF